MPQVSSRMMAEHMPDRLLRILQRLARSAAGEQQQQQQPAPAAAPQEPPQRGARRSAARGRRGSVDSITSGRRSSVTRAERLDDLDFASDSSDGGGAD